MKKQLCANRNCLKLLEPLVEQAILKDDNAKQQVAVRAIFKHIGDYFDSYEHRRGTELSRKFILKGIRRHMDCLADYFTNGTISDNCEYDCWLR